LAVIISLNRGAGLAWRAAVIRQMLKEANTTASRLNLPVKRPLLGDIQDAFVPDPWFDVAFYRAPDGMGYPDTIFGTNIYNDDIPRHKRLQSIKITLDGRLDVGNFSFSFYKGRLRGIMRLENSQMEYDADRLNELAGKQSLIDTNGAYQLACQWLTMLGVNVAELENQSAHFPNGGIIEGGHKVIQSDYPLPGTTNAVSLPVFYVYFGGQHFPAQNKLRAFDEPLCKIEILGTTKEVQQIVIGKNSMDDALPYYHVPQLLVSNALELLHTPNPTPEQLQNPATAQAYTLTPQQVLSYTRNYFASARTNAGGHVYYPLALSTNEIH
jgi:hypothetical protein